MKYIIDTNVWISYFLWKTPILDNLISSITQSGEIFASEETLEEFFQTIDKEKFENYLDNIQKEQICSDVIHRSNIILVNIQIHDCRYPRDNVFLELDPWRDVRILTPRQCIELIDI